MTNVPYTRTTNAAAEVAALPSPARRALDRRIGTLLQALAVDGAHDASLDERLTIAADAVGRAPERVWLAHAVIAGALPSDDDMTEALVRARLAGPLAALAPALASMADTPRFRPVEVVTGKVTCDVHTTAESHFLSGIQRVVRETASRWESTHDVTFLGWTRDMRAFRPIRHDERQRVLGHSSGPRQDAGVLPVIVPWDCDHLWVEVITHLDRTSRLLAMAQYSTNRVGVLGFDSIPVTSSATVAKGMTSHFARSLAAVRRADRVALISRAAAEEFSGVMDMGAGRRDGSPVVAAIPLATAAPPASAADLREASVGLVVEGTPMVLVVGSHEPRKNHLAVLHAAETLWREGRRFSLVFVGAGAWASEEYQATVAALAGMGRPVQSLRALPDRLLSAAYRLAHCTLFPSLNEGFGLPVAESLAAGTPVITSDYGSMRDIVAPRGSAVGGLLVDPRDDTSVADALRTMLSDPVVYARLRAEAATFPSRTWDDYAAELWAFLVDGAVPTSGTSS